jgi:hypothetical protein
MWACPKCNRKFRNNNQQHSCVSIDAAVLFINKDLFIEEAYKTLLAKMKVIGPFDISPTRSTIFLKHNSTFAAIKPKKDSLVLEFFFNKEIKNPLIQKSFKLSANRTVHIVEIRSKKDINKKILDWIKKSYALTKI